MSVLVSQLSLTSLRILCTCANCHRVHQVKMKHGLHDADMPNIEKFRSKLAKVDFSAFPAVRAATLQQLDDIISADIPRVSAACFTCST
jgi:Domain of unknown function (DUF5600)